VLTISKELVEHSMDHLELKHLSNIMLFLFLSLFFSSVAAAQS
jgi:hypothetical protein